MCIGRISDFIIIRLILISKFRAPGDPWKSSVCSDLSGRTFLRAGEWCKRAVSLPVRIIADSRFEVLSILTRILLYFARTFDDIRHFSKWNLSKFSDSCVPLFRGDQNSLPISSYRYSVILISISMSIFLTIVTKQFSCRLKRSFHTTKRRNLREKKYEVQTAINIVKSLYSRRKMWYRRPYV